MSLDRLPPEILLAIAEHLPSERNVDRLLRTCCRLYSTLNRYLYRRNVLHGDSSALWWAAKNGIPQTIPHTLAAGANVNLYARATHRNWVHDISPLRHAVNHKHLAGDAVFNPQQRLIGIPGGCIVLSPLTNYDATIKVLLDHGADPSFCGNKLGGERDSIVGEAARNGDIKLVKLLLEYGAKPDGLFGAIDERHTDIVELLLDHGADPNSKNRPGTCVLYVAARVGSADVVRVLLERGADINTSLGEGVTALHYAAIGGDPATIRLLVDRGLSVNTPDSSGRSPLHWAAIQGRTEAMKTLVELNASPDTANNYGCTPLLVASNSSHKFASPEIFAEAIDLLLNAGANINARTRTGRSALHLALEGGAWRGIPAAAMRVLVDRGVDVSSKDETGRTALMVGLRTRKSDRDELVAILARKSQRLTKKPRLRYKEENDEDD